MTYNVFSGTLNPTHSLTHPVYTIGLLYYSLVEMLERTVKEGVAGV